MAFASLVVTSEIRQKSTGNFMFVHFMAFQFLFLKPKANAIINRFMNY